VASGKEYNHFANIFDVSELTIHNWIKGKSIPHIKYWDRLARIFLLDKTTLTLYYTDKLKERIKKI